MKKCKICGNEFVPYKNHQIACKSQKCKKMIIKSWWNDYKKSLAYKKSHDKSDKRWCLKNPEYHLNKNKTHYAENRQKILKYHDVYRKTEEGKLIRLKSRAKRRHKEKNIKHNFTLEEWKQKIELTKGICPICFKPFKLIKEDRGRCLTMNHEPALDLVEEGHIYTINDVTPMCLSCNSKIKNKLFKTDFFKVINIINKKIKIGVL
jgi:hypothetical protein